MQAEKSLSWALFLVWVTYVSTVPMLYLQALLHQTSRGELMGSLLVLTVFGLIPYFLTLRKNWARHLFAGEVALSVLTLALGLQVPALTPLEQGLYWGIETLEGAAVWLLYQPTVAALFQKPRR